MSIKTKVGTPMILRLVAAILGAVLGAVVSTKLVSAAPQSIYSSGGVSITVGDLISIAVGVGLAIFGNRIHPLVRWFGVGYTAAVVGSKLTVLVPA